MKLIEELQLSSECTLNTFFRADDLDDESDDSPFHVVLIDELPSSMV